MLPSVQLRHGAWKCNEKMSVVGNLHEFPQIRRFFLYLRHMHSRLALSGAIFCLLAM